jgi:hypothetical protein
MTARITTHDELLGFFRQQTRHSDPGPYASVLDVFPQDVGGACAVLHGVMLHMWWISRETRGFTRADLGKGGRDIFAEISLRTVADRVRKILATDPRPLSEPREAKRRVVSNCRDYALMLIAVLRHQGTSARVRTGSARYLVPNRLEDHWICEFWNERDGRWHQVDPQVDDVIRRSLKLTFDPMDLPAGQFLSGWQCYDELASGRVEPKALGFPFEPWGMAYARYKMFQDMAAVTGQEIVPWAGWGIGGPDGGDHPKDAELTRTMADVLREIDHPEALEKARELMATHERLVQPEGLDPGSFRKEWLAA